MESSLTDTSDLPAHGLRRLAYFTHPDAEIGKALCDSFLEHNFHFSMVPDMAGIARLVPIRRPDLLLMPIGDARQQVDEALEVLDTFRASHLGIVAFLLAPAGARAELVAAAVRRGASEVFSPPYSAPTLSRQPRKPFVA